MSQFTDYKEQYRAKYGAAFDEGKHKRDEGGKFSAMAHEATKSALAASKGVSESNALHNAHKHSESAVDAAKRGFRSYAASHHKMAAEHHESMADEHRNARYELPAHKWGPHNKAWQAHKDARDAHLTAAHHYENS